MNALDVAAQPDPAGYLDPGGPDVIVPVDWLADMAGRDQ